MASSIFSSVVRLSTCYLITDVVLNYNSYQEEIRSELLGQPVASLMTSSVHDIKQCQAKSAYQLWNVFAQTELWFLLGLLSNVKMFEEGHQRFNPNRCVYTCQRSQEDGGMPCSLGKEQISECVLIPHICPKALLLQTYLNSWLLMNRILTSPWRISRLQLV